MKCTAVKFNGEPCKNRAMVGLNVCRSHGGGSPRSRAKSRRAKLVKALDREFAKLEVSPVGDPLQAFADLTAETVAFKDWLAGRVAELREMRYEDVKGAEQLRSEVALYERAMDRAGKFLTDWVRLGLDERMVKLSEQQGQIIANLLRDVFADPELGLSDEQRQQAMTVTGRHLRVVA